MFQIYEPIIPIIITLIIIQIIFLLSLILQEIVWKITKGKSLRYFYNRYWRYERKR